MTDLHLDYETQSELDLKLVGLDRYSQHPSTKVLLGGYAFDDGAVSIWQPHRGEPMPRDLAEAMEDPEVYIHAFNAQFERWITNKVLGIKVPRNRWRCAQVLAYMLSFTGGLEDVGKQMGLPVEKQKLAEGRKLVKMFCGPNKPTKNQPFVWRDSLTDPEEWDKFVNEYLPSDVISEREIVHKLRKFEVPDKEWELYVIDQIINDRGLPVNRPFVESAITLAERRKSEIISEMKERTGLDNPNSTTQLLPWIQDRGYYYRDLQKDSIKKIVAEEKALVEDFHKMIEADGRKLDEVKSVKFSRPTWGTVNVTKNDKETTERIVSEFEKVEVPPPRFNGIGEVVGDAMLTQECRDILKMRLASAKTSTAKYEACLNGMGDDDRLRHCFQFDGASRTGRWAGRKIQPQNLPRTPKYLEPEDHISFDRLNYVNDLIEAGDYDTLQLFTGEVMDAVSGCVRSCVAASPGKELVVCDLSSIETVVIGWLTECDRLLNVFRNGLCAYKDFATTLYGVSYDAVTKGQRTDSKPAVLGAGYRLSGGEMRDGKKTGLWGYAENMGINLTLEQAQRAVRLYRETYKEVPQAWYKIEDAVVACLRSGRKTYYGPLEFELRKPFLRVRLPSGRFLYYYKAQVFKTEMEGKYGPYEKWFISYMGINQVTTQWDRIESHGGKFIENFVQAIARDILADGIRAAHLDGFYIVGHVHDEIICEQDIGDSQYTWERLRELMSIRPSWAPDIPLGAAGYSARVYRKD